MKKFTPYFLLILFFTSFLFAQGNYSKNKTLDNTVSKYKRIKIDKSIPNLLQKLDAVGVDLGCGVFHTENYIQIELSEYELKRISENEIPYTVLIEDVTKFYADRAKKDMPLAQSNLLAEKRRSTTAKSSSVKSVAIGNIGQRDDSAEINWTTPTNFTIPSTFSGMCLTYTGMAAELDKMRLLYPNLISVKANASPTDQKTYEGRPIYYVKISDNPDTNETEPQVLYTGMTHSREASSLMNQIYFMWYVLENYSTDPFIKNLVDNTEMFFIPVVNPDGLTYNETTAPTGGGMQRKNRRPNGGGCTGTLEGVDINRNFGYYYGLTATETTKCADAYRGTAAFSESETQIIRDFVLSKNIKTALNHHGYANIIPHPINGKATTLSGRENEFAKFSHDMSQYNRYLYGAAPGILYAASGDASDWMCGGTNDGTGSTGSGKNILSASPESGSSAEGGFWPTASNMTIIAKRAMRMNFINAYYAGKYAKFHDLTQSDITALSSNLTFGIERLGQTAGNFTLTVTPVSTNIVSITSPAAVTGMTILQQTNVTAAIVLSPTIKANEKVEYKISLSNGDYVLYEANYVKIYNPTVLFNNNPDIDLLTKWTATGTAWVNTASTFTGTKSISDTAAGTAYLSGLNESTTAKSKILTTTAAISLAGAQKVLVQFYAKWDIERNYDLVQIQGSKDGGTTWVTLNGTYTKPTATTETNYLYIKSAADAAFQNSGGGGGVIYDGDTMGKWVMEEIVIDASNNSFLVGSTTAKFRFRMKTDSQNLTSGYTTTFDGFYFDDFKVIKQISEPPVAICKDTTLSLNSSGALTVLPSDVNNGSSDDIGITSITVSPNTFNCTHANTTQSVTLTVTDADGQTSTCTSNVTIKDITPPVIPTLTNVTAQCSATPTTPTTTDICKGTITGTTTTTFPITTQGTTVVTWSFDDGNGQIVTANQNVIIDDTVAPVTPTLANITGQCSVTPTAPTTTDACAGTITGTTATIFPITTPGTTVITWNFNDGNGQSINVNQNVIIASTTWNGSSWSNGTPTSSTAAIISGNYSVASNITACNLTVNNNAVVTIPSGYNVTLNGALTLSSGSFTLNNNANLIQTSNAANSGNITVLRNSSALMRLDYSLWSSPVANQNLLNFSPLTSISRFYNYNATTNLYNALASPSTTNFTDAQGYLIRMPNTHPATPTVWNGSFTGVPHNGTYSITMTNGGIGKRFNLVGNPYPSTISMTQFVADNNTAITGTLYFWRKTNNPLNPSYCTWTGGIFVSNGQAQVVNPNGIIQTGQGFFVEALNSSTSLTFNNGQRSSNTTGQFFKTKQSIERSTIWLNASNILGNFSQMAVSYIADATQGVDTYDGKYYNDGDIALNSILDNTDYVIQGRSLPFDGTDVVPLSFSTKTAGDYIISIDHVEGLFSGNQDIILKDNVTGTETDLKTNAYSFTTAVGYFSSRFELKYQKTLGTNTPVFNENNILVHKNKGIIHINSGNTIMHKVQLFDIRGRFLLEKTQLNANETAIESSNFIDQVLILKIITKDNKVVSKKISN